MDEAQITVIEQLRIKDPLLDQQILHQSSDFAYHGFLAAEAKHAARMSELRAKVVTAQLKEEARTTLAKASEWSVNAYVESNPQFREVWENCYRLQLQADLMTIAKDAFTQRKDMLMSRASDLRSERRGEMKVNG